MEIIKCDRCGAQVPKLANRSVVSVDSTFCIYGCKNKVDLCETCTKQFFSHFMKNHWSYKNNEHI